MTKMKIAIICALVIIACSFVKPSEGGKVSDEFEGCHPGIRCHRDPCVYTECEKGMKCINCNCHQMCVPDNGPPTQEKMECDPDIQCFRDPCMRALCPRDWQCVNCNCRAKCMLPSK